MKKLLLLLACCISAGAQSNVPSVPAHIEFTLSNTDPTGSCTNPTVFYFNYIDSAMWGCQISVNARLGAWVQQNPAVGGGVTSVNGQTGIVSITIPTDNTQLTNNAGYATAAQVPGLSAVQSVNGLTGNVNIAVPTLLSQLTNDSAFITATSAPVLSVNGLTGAVVLPSANNYQTVQVNGVGVTQRAKLNLAAGANTTITPTDNGSDTTTLTVTTTGGGGGGLPDPGANGLVKRTALNTTVAGTAGTDYYAPGTLISDADLPGSITSDITGNAATATALKTAPSGCAGGQFVTQISANGTPFCGSAGSGGPTVTTGTAVPVAGNCTAGASGSVYLRTGITVNTNSSGSDTYICSNPTGTYRWTLQTPQKVNVMSYGCKADGSTDDSGCFNAAIADAKLMTHYTSGVTGFWGADVYIPNGKYEIANPIILPRNASGPNGASNGVVGLIGESPNGVSLEASSSFPIAATDVFLMAEGSGYSGTPTVTFTGGCSTEPVATVIVSKSTYIGKVFVTSPGSGCTSMPTCTINAGGSGSGALCQVTGRAMIEWDQNSSFATSGGRIGGQRIININFYDPKIVGAMAIHKQDVARPDTPSSSGTHIEDERFEGLQLINLGFQGSNQYNPLDIFLDGDCFGCFFSQLNSNSGQGTLVYNTVLLGTDVWMQGSTTDENAGLNFSTMVNLYGGGARGGYDAVFQGRMGRTNFGQAFCDGQTNTTPNPQCYAFYNSGGNIITNIANEGINDNPEILFFNSDNNFVNRLGIGAPNSLAGNGMELRGGSSGNTFDGHIAAGVSYASIGKFEVLIDSTSINNKFLNWQTVVAASSAFSVSDLTDNYFQTCQINCTAGYTTYGYIAGMSMNGTNTQPTCNANTRGALWPVRNGSGVADHVQACLQTGVGTTLAWTTIF